MTDFGGERLSGPLRVVGASNQELHEGSWRLYVRDADMVAIADLTARRRLGIDEQ
jgi:hypothetical protein